MPKVSVIMPCLNMEKYIRQCLNSVVCQTLKEIEIIIVDAGSKDGTLEILREYAREDARIQVLHSDKKSYGYQMNRGIAMASGEYIGIVETDDFIEPDMMAVLYGKAVETGADYVKGTGQGFYDGPGEMIWQFPIVPCRGLEENEMYVAVPKEETDLFLEDNFLWNGIYRREFIQNIKFQETPGAAFQDIGALFQIISSADRGVYLRHLFYHYRQDNTSASSYNKNGFVYAASEYGYMEQFLRNLSVKWYTIYYLKMAGLCMDRFQVMGASGTFWSETVAEIEALRKKLQKAVEEGTIGQEDCEAWQQSLWKELELFLKEPYRLYELHKNIYDAKKNALEQIVDTACSQRVVLFGAGKGGQFVHMCLALWGIVDVVAYCDNSEKIQGAVLWGCEVVSPEEAVKRESGAYFIITAGENNAREMKSQLMALGVPKKAIGIYDKGVDRRLFHERYVRS